MRYEDALHWLYARQRFGIKQGLENMTRLLAELDNPERSFRAVHITGTTGKGSVAALAESALRQAGHRTARYTSPHLNRFTERITVGGQEIPPADVGLLADQARPVVDALDAEGVKPTFFEVVTALAFQYFRRRRVDVAVVEVGMGGRWDATNLVEPVATAVTNVGLDHVDRLGSTVAAIAAEKAGILKPGVPCATRAVGDAYDVVRRRAKEIGAPLEFVGAPEAEESLSGTRVHLAYAGETLDVRLSLLGRHQAENAAVAAKTLEACAAFPVPADALRAGFARATWPGRLEPASKDPLVLLDGAHNGPGATALAGFVERVVRPRRVHALLGVLRDKNLAQILSPLLPVVDRWVATTVPNQARALPASGVVSGLAAQGAPAAAVEEVVEAIRTLHSDAARDDVLLVTGSLFLVGAARAALLKTPTDPPLPYAVTQ